MKRVCIPHAGWAVMLLSVLALVVVPARAQGVSLESVEPSEGQPGQELDLTLRGSGFGGANWASVTVGEFEATDVRIESDQVIRARLRIPDDAQPGSRDVRVVVSFGQNEDFPAVLPGGFSVSVSGPSGPVDGGVDPGWLLLLIIIVVVGAVAGGAALAVTLALRARRSALQEQWQKEAKEEELPKTCRAGTPRVVREKPEVKPGRWKVAGLKVTLYEEAGKDQRAGGTARDVPPKLVDRIDKAARNRLLWGDSEKLAQEATDIGRELAALIVAWQSLSKTGRDVHLEPRIAGGEASVKFVLYRCVGRPGRWKKVSEWNAKLQAVNHFPRSFRGPAGGERPEAYRAMLEKGLGIYVHKLIREVGRLLGLRGVEFSGDVSIG